MRKLSFVLLAVFMGVSLASGMAFAAAPFYEGKTVRIIVGYSPGGATMPMPE